MLVDALQFLLNTFINLLTLIFLLRFFMQLFKAPFNNPLGQMVMTLSNFAVKPLRRFLPSVGKIDVSTLLLAVLAQFLLQYCLILLRGYPLALAGQPAWLGLIGLSFLGVGAQPPMPSWGNMIKEHYGYIVLNKAYLALAPGCAIMLLVLAFTLLGNGLRDALDTRSVN